MQVSQQSCQLLLHVAVTRVSGWQAAARERGLESPFGGSHERWGRICKVRSGVVVVVVVVMVVMVEEEEEVVVVVFL
jgi:hypothetical protein